MQKLWIKLKSGTGLRNALFLIGLFVFATFAAFQVLLPNGPIGDGSHKVEFEIPRGRGASYVARRLYEEGLIDNPSAFRFLLRITNRSAKLKAGVYSLHDGLSLSEIANILTEGKTKLISITIPEGWNHRQIGDYLAQKGFVKNRKEFLQISRSSNVLKKYNILDPSTEGYLFPETYKIPPHYAPEKIQELMLRRFFLVLKEIIKKTDKSWQAKEIRDRIVLASVIEREAVRPEERPMMARVFLNRIARGMRLESCATIQYLFDKPHPKLYNRDLEILSPYNTYKHKGLPPGPISNPGRAALEAAFFPAQNDYLYFLLKPDGSHYFSRTYEEHLRAKKKYID